MIKETTTHPQKRLFYGWVIVAVMSVVGSLSMALGTLNFGLFIRPMGDELGIGRAVFGLAQTARMVVGAATSPIVGRLIDRLGSRLLLPIAAFITGAALIGVSTITQGWQLVALFGIMGVVAIGGPANLTTTVPIAKWFVRKRGLAMAFVTVGPFAGGIVFVPLTQLLIDSLGWRNAWIVLAVVGAGLIIPLALLLVRRQPEDMGLAPDGMEPRPQPAAASVQIAEHNAFASFGSEEVSWTVQEVIRSPTFWVLTGVFSLVMLSVGAVGLHRIPNFVDRGIDPRLVAIATSLDATAGGFSTFTLGFLADRIPVRFLGGAAFVLLSSAVFLTIVGNNAFVMFLSFIFFGLGIGGMMLFNSFLWADYYGRAHLGSIRGLVMPITLFFSGVSAPMSGYVRDVTGTYNNIWSISVLLLLIATLVIVFTKPPVKKTRGDQRVS